jgi:hypothetical protein
MPWIAALAALGLSSLAPAASEPAVHGEFSVEVVDIAGKEGDDEEAQALELRRGPKVIASYPASGYVKEAYWSPEGKWVAVNVRDANSGDYIWVLEVANGALVRKPSEEEDAWETAGYAAFKALDKKAVPDNMLHFWKNAVGWTEDGKLNVVLRADYAEGAGKFDYIVPMTVSAAGLEPGKAKVERVPEDE